MLENDLKTMYASNQPAPPAGFDERSESQLLRLISQEETQMKDSTKRTIYIAGRSVSRVLALAVLLLILLAATALAAALLTPKEVVEQVAVPLAQQNDLDWRINDEFSPEELASFIRACNENGIDLNENSAIMQAFKKGEGYFEEEAIMDVCRQAFGGTYWEWTIAQRRWYQEIMTQMGFMLNAVESVPGPDDLKEEEARAILISAIKEAIDPKLPLEDQTQYFVMISYLNPPENGAAWKLRCEEKREPMAAYEASLDKGGQVLSVQDVTVPNDPPPLDQRVFTLSEDEAAKLAADGLTEQTGLTVPLMDPEKYHYFSYKSAEDPVWELHFISHTGEFGNCVILVNDATREVTIRQADVGDVTADNILDRYKAQYGWYGDWDQEIWAKMSQEMKPYSAETTLGTLLKKTEYIQEREGLLTRLQAEEAAFRKMDLRNGDVNCAVLIGASPHPIWKLRLVPYDETYAETVVVEIDAVTGDLLEWDYYKSDHPDLEPPYHMFILHRTWAKTILEEQGPVPLAGLCVIHQFGDLTLDEPETELPLFDPDVYTPKVSGTTVRFEAQKAGFSNYTVILDENGLPSQVTKD